LFKKLTSYLKQPSAVVKNYLGPTGEDHGTVTTSDLDFEAVA